MLPLPRPLLLYWESNWSSWDGVTSSQLSSVLGRAGRGVVKDQPRSEEGCRDSLQGSKECCCVIGVRQHSTFERH